MIECLPKSLCSWDFTAGGLSSGRATVEYDWFTEQGRIIDAHIAYDIRKHGVFSGHWTLEQAGGVVAEAHKPSAMFRSFEVAGGIPDSTQAFGLDTPVVEAYTYLYFNVLDRRDSPAYLRAAGITGLLPRLGS